MRLSQDDKRILQFMNLRAGLPLESAARALEMRPHSIRYTIDKLSKSGALRLTVPVDQSRLGFQTFNILFSLTAGSRELRQNVIEYLRSCPSVGWATEVGGDYEFEVTLLGKSTADLAYFFAGLVQIGCRFARKDIVLENAQTFYGIRFVDIDQSQVISFSLCNQGKILDLDELDRKILYGLTHNKFRNLTELGRTLRIPPTSLGYRLQKLEASGLVGPLVYMVDHKTLEFVRTHVLLRNCSLNENFRSRLFKFCSENSAVFALVSSIGSWDYKLVTLTSQQSDLKRLIDSLRSQFGVDLDEISQIPCYDTLRMEYFPKTTKEPYCAVNRQKVVNV